MTYALPNMSTDLSGQTALVAGASSGLGLRFAKVLASCGAKVALEASVLTARVCGSGGWTGLNQADTASPNAPQVEAPPI